MSIQRLAGFATVALIAVGLAKAGLFGGLTGLLAGISLSTGAAIFRGERGTEVESVHTSLGKWQRFGGLVLVVATGAAVWRGGWSRGWLWVVAPFAVAMAIVAGGPKDSRAPARPHRTR